MLREPFLVDSPASAVYLGDLRCRNCVILNVPPREPHEGCIGANNPKDRHPPDVPDHREPDEEGEEGGDDPDWAIPRKLDRLVLGLRRLLSLDGPALDLPIGLRAVHPGQHCEVEGGRWRRRCPFERTAIPGIASVVPKFVAVADADAELDYLTDHGAEQEYYPERRRHDPRVP